MLIKGNLNQAKGQEIDQKKQMSTDTMLLTKLKKILNNQRLVQNNIGLLKGFKMKTLKDNRFIKPTVKIIKDNNRENQTKIWCFQVKINCHFQK